MDLKKLKESAEQGLATWDQRGGTLNERVLHLAEVLSQAIESSTPWSRPTTLSRPGFTPACREIQKTAKRARRDLVRWQAHHQTEAPEEMQRECNKEKEARKRIQHFRM